MYKLEYLLVAQRDMVEIVRYISGKLQKPDAADCLVMELVNVAERVITFSYALPAYQPIRLLKREYRKILVQNFLMFYWVDEEKKLVTVARVMYAKRDIRQIAGVMKGRMAKTIKEIADNCGVPEQTVRGWCRRNHVAKESFAFSKSPKARYSICHTGSAVCNFERMVQLKFQVAERRKSGIMNK